MAAQCPGQSTGVDEHVEGALAHHVVEYRRVTGDDSETCMPYSSARSAVIFVLNSRLSTVTYSSIQEP